MNRRHDDIDEAKLFVIAWIVLSALCILFWWGK